MPKSLDVGPSKSVQIKCCQADKIAIVAVLREGETLSELTRRCGWFRKFRGFVRGERFSWPSESDVRNDYDVIELDAAC